jgi:hypothetical protein
MRCTEAIANSISHADRNNFDQAKKVLEDAKQALVNESLAYRAGDNAVLRSMFTDLQDCMQRTTSRQVYERDGGRATMSEHFDGHSKQRRVFSKPCMGASHVSPYQTISSSRQQTAACYSKAPTPVVSSSFGQSSQPVTSSVSQNASKNTSAGNKPTKAYCMHMGKTGTCPYGDMCFYSHTLPPCTYFQKGKCTKINCPFPHVLTSGTDADVAAKPAAQPIVFNEHVLPVVPNAYLFQSAEELMRHMGISSTTASGDSSTSPDTAANQKKEEQQKEEDKDKK